MPTDEDAPKTSNAKRYLLASGLPLGIAAVAVLIVNFAIAARETDDAPSPGDSTDQAGQEEETLPAPHECVGEKLPLLDGTNMSSATSVDPEGEYIAGWTYSEDETATDGYRVVVWHGDDTMEIDVPGVNQSIKSLNRHGEGIGQTYVDEEMYSFVYLDDNVTVLEADPETELSDINDDGAFVGTRTSANHIGVPVIWYAADAEPVELTVPDEAPHGEARAIGDNGTIAGSVSSGSGMEDSQPYIWDAEGNGMPLDMGDFAPEAFGQVEGIAGNWIYGIVAEPGEDGNEGVFTKWNLDTLDVERVDGSTGNYMNSHGWITGDGSLGHFDPFVEVDGERTPLPDFDIDVGTESEGTEDDEDLDQHRHWPNGISDTNIIGTVDTEPGSELVRGLRAVVWTCE